MASTSPNPARVRVDGKFFRLAGDKFCVKGVTYGPFAPNDAGEHFASREQTIRDFNLIAELGANIIRVYNPPPLWLLDLAQEHGLKVFVDIPWAKHLCFIDSPKWKDDARKAVRDTVEACHGHPAVFAFSVVNEISPEIVRWSGVQRVEAFIDELVREAKAIDPGCLCTFTSFPSTEFLQPQEVDFICFNVYLHHPPAFEAYLARLQSLAGEKPLMLGELGMDSIREGEPHKCEFLTWQIELAFRAGLAGTIVFSFTDDWFRGGRQIEDWAFGLTTRERKPKESFSVVQKQYELAPRFPLPRAVRASVVVATYNGSRTLKSCLESLGQLNYPDYEVIVVDDGSEDAVPEVVKDFPAIRYVRQTHQGLSTARNTGIHAATGEVIAFTDDDCRADEDWLYYLVDDLLRGDFSGIGGHNLLPLEDSNVAAAVLISPGGPAHVMLTDRLAEHIPGCNMAYYKWALQQIGCFDHTYWKAGDDVDVCWRLQDSGLKIGFSHGGFVWHYRRSTVQAYLKQQAGYGEAEALLMAKHPEHFGSFGGGIWRGRIYASSYSGVFLRRPVIYHGLFGSGLFQRLYSPRPVESLLLCTSLAYHVFVTLPLLVLGAAFPVILPIAAGSAALSVGVCVLAAAQANIPPNKRRFWSRPLVALLFFLQPIVRDWARFKRRFHSLATAKMPAPAAIQLTIDDPRHACVYWSDGSIDRYQFLKEIMTGLEQSGWTFETDTGWTSHDLEIRPHVWTSLEATTASEDLELGLKNFRCRITGAWSFPAKVVFFGVCVLVFILISQLGTDWPWAWFALLLLPLTAWYIDDTRMEFQSALGAFIDTAAAKLKLKKLEC
jgi:glycosyltransferase involved in cell wall biosynthesis